MKVREEDLLAGLARFYRDTKDEVSLTPPIWILPNRRAGGWLQPILVSLALVVVALGVVMGLHVAREQAQKLKTVASPTSSASPQSSWISRQLQFGEVQAMTIDGSAVYALYDPTPSGGSVDPSLTKLARIDRVTGTITTAGPFPGAMRLARIDAGLWIGGSALQLTGNDSQWLTLVDPQSLRVERRVPLPALADASNHSVAQLAGTSNLLWLGYGQHAYRLNPATGSILLTQELPGIATSVAVDPSGHRVYVGVDLSGSQTNRDIVIEWDASSGARLASAPTGGIGLGGPQLAAASDGVWIAYATGNLGMIEHRAADGLTIIPVGGQAGQTHANGIHVFMGGGSLWLVDSAAQLVACANPQTGTIAASARESLPAVIVADPVGTYLGNADGVAFLRPDTACRK